MKKQVLFLLNATILLPIGLTYADEKTENPDTTEAPTIHLEAMIVNAESNGLSTSRHDTLDAESIANKRSQVTDTAKLLEDTAGMSFQSGGGISSLPITRCSSFFNRLILLIIIMTKKI